MKSDKVNKKYIAIVPAYNPDSKLPLFVADLKEYFDQIIVINDGSDPAHLPIFQSLEDTCIVLNHYFNQGKGRAIKTGLNKAYELISKGGNYGGIVTADADGQHKLEDVLKVRNAMASSNNTVILGVRDFSSKGIPARSRFGNNITKQIMKYLCGISVSDTQTGLRGIPTKFIGLLLSTEGERYEYETNCLLTIRQNNIAIDEVSISTIYENDNKSSHFNPLIDSFIIYKVIFKYSLSSLLSVAVDFSVFTICIALGLKIWVSIFVGRIVSTGINFLLNKKAVFKAKGHTVQQLIKYIVLVLISGGIVAMLISLLTRIMRINVVLAKAIIESFMFFINYCIQKNYIFNPKR